MNQMARMRCCAAILILVAVSVFCDLTVFLDSRKTLHRLFWTMQDSIVPEPVKTSNLSAFGAFTLLPTVQNHTLGQQTEVATMHGVNLTGTSVNFPGAIGDQQMLHEENWNLTTKCLNKPMLSTSFSLTVGFDVGWAGLTNQHVGLLHGFAVAYLLGAQAILEPQLRIGINHESSHNGSFTAVVAEAKASGSVKEVSLQYYYDRARITEALSQLNLTLLPDEPRDVQIVNLTLHRDMRGEPMEFICSEVRQRLARSNFTHIFLNLGLAAGLLRVDGTNLGLITFIDRHLQYNERIRLAAQSILDNLPSTFNGIHLRISDEASKSWRIVCPKDVVPKLTKLGFFPNTTLFVASGVPAERYAKFLQPFNVKTILDFGSGLHLDSFGPINQLVLEKATRFTGFSLSSYSCAIARHRWLRNDECDRTYDTYSFFDTLAAPMFLWRGDWRFWPLCRDDGQIKYPAPILTKKTVSGTSRFVFFAGIEGTGHHVWQKLLPSLQPFENWSNALSTALYDFPHKVGFFSSYDAAVRAKAAVTVGQLLTDADRHVSKQGGGIVPLNVLCENKSGMISFPNFLGPDRVIQNPDIHALATLAEDVRVDLRIVLLIRNPESVVRSAMRRHFEPDAMHAIKKYTMSLALLSAQLNLVDPSFIACWRYEMPTQGITDLLSFMGSRQHPRDFGNIIHKTFRADTIQSSTYSDDRNAALQTATLMNDQMIERYCRPIPGRER